MVDLDKKIEELDLVFLDLETTGLDAVTGDAICEVGALKVSQEKIIDKFHSLINPKRNIPDQAYRIHKISNQDVASSPCFEDIADKLLQFLKGSVICAYNVNFDMGFIDNHLMRVNRPRLSIFAIDILAMARDALSLPRYNLENVANFFNIDCKKVMHRALEDANIAYKVFFGISDKLSEKGLVRFGDFFSLYGFNNDPFRSMEEEKLSLLREAIEKHKKLRIKVFYKDGVRVEDEIMPLRISQERGIFYLLCQKGSEPSLSIRLGSMLEVLPSPQA